MMYIVVVYNYSCCYTRGSGAASLYRYTPGMLYTGRRPWLRRCCQRMD